MGQYVAPLRDMQFVMYELLRVGDELKQLLKHADIITLRYWKRAVNVRSGCYSG